MSRIGHRLKAYAQRAALVLGPGEAQHRLFKRGTVAWRCMQPWAARHAKQGVVLLGPMERMEGGTVGTTERRFSLVRRTL